MCVELKYLQVRFCPIYFHCQCYLDELLHGFQILALMVVGVALVDCGLHSGFGLTLDLCPLLTYWLIQVGGLHSPIPKIWKLLSNHLHQDEEQ